jgi:hypothetical protein
MFLENADNNEFLVFLSKILILPEDLPRPVPAAEYLKRCLLSPHCKIFPDQCRAFR